MSNYSITDAAVLSGLVNQNLPRKPWLANNFFGVKLHDTLQIGFDVIAGSKTLAPFRANGAASTTVTTAGVSTKWFNPHQISLKIATNAIDAAKRGAGMQLSYADGVKTLEERVAFKIGQDQVKMVNQIYASIEKMCSDALYTGTVNNYDENGDLIETYDMGFKTDHKITLTGSDLWTASTSKPLENIDEYMNLIADDAGLATKAVVCGKDVVKALRTNSLVLDQLKANNSLYAAIHPQMAVMGAQFIGYTSSGVGIWYCNESYTDSAGTAQPMVPADSIAVIGDGVVADVHFGMIEDRKAGGFVGEIFSKTWEDEDPSVQWLKCASAPLAVIAQPDGVVTAKVV